MLTLLAGLKSFFKIDSTVIDNNIFRLHYKATTVILIVFSLLVTARQYIGDPIDCMSTSADSVPGNMLDTFCWVTTTFSMPDAWHGRVGAELDVPYPGIKTYKKGDKRVFHAYYQWVCFVLFLQGVMFYMPRYFWKIMEGKTVKNLVMGLDCPVVDEDTKSKNQKILVDYLTTSVNTHHRYFFWYILAEIMNWVNVIGQIFLIDVFLGGEFSKYGVEVLKFTEWDGSIRFDPMVKVFPRVTKCQFHKFGSSGDVVNIDALCVLPINIINEKIYIFLWFWFIILAVISSLGLIYRCVIIFWPESRLMIIHSRNKLVETHILEALVKRLKLGDWLLLDFLSKNLDPLHFKEIVKQFSTNIGEKHMDYVTC